MYLVYLALLNESIMIKKSNLIKNIAVLQPTLASEELIHYLQIGGFRWFKYETPQDVIILYNINVSEAQTVCDKYM